MKFLAHLLIFGFVFAKDNAPHFAFEIQPVSDRVVPEGDVGMTIEDLPKSVIIKIASLIPAEELPNLASVCKALNGACTLEKTTIDADQRAFQLRAEIIINDKKLISPEDIASLKDATRNEFQMILKTASIISDMEKSVFGHIAADKPTVPSRLWTAEQRVRRRFFFHIKENAPPEVAQNLRSGFYTERRAFLAGVFYPPAVGVKLFDRAEAIVRDAKGRLRADNALMEMFVTNKEYRTLYLTSVVGDIYGDLPLAERLDKLLYLNLVAHEQNKNLSIYLQKISRLAIGRSDVLLGSYMQSANFPQRQKDTKIILNGVDRSVKFFETAADDASETPLPNLVARSNRRPYPRLETLMAQRLKHARAISQTELYTYRTRPIYRVQRFLRQRPGDSITGALAWKLVVYLFWMCIPQFVINMTLVYLELNRKVREAVAELLVLVFLIDLIMKPGVEEFDADLDERLLSSLPDISTFPVE